MNKTTVKTLQLIIRENKSVQDIAKSIGKSKNNIYSSFADLRKCNILDKNNKLNKNELLDAYKLLFLKYPYDFSFLTKNNLEILFLLIKGDSFSNLIKRTNLSRYTVNQLLKELKKRGFVDRENKLIQPNELIELIEVIKYYHSHNMIELPGSAVFLTKEIIQSEMALPLNKTAFSAFNIGVISPHKYYTTKKKITKKDIFQDARKISRTTREKFIMAVYYKNNNLKDEEFDRIIQTKEFNEFYKENG